MRKPLLWPLSASAPVLSSSRPLGSTLPPPLITTGSPLPSVSLTFGTLYVLLSPRLSPGAHFSPSPLCLSGFSPFHVSSAITSYLPDILPEPNFRIPKGDKCLVPQTKRLQRRRLRRRRSLRDFSLDTPGSRSLYLREGPPSPNRHCSGPLPSPFPTWGCLPFLGSMAGTNHQSSIAFALADDCHRTLPFEPSPGNLGPSHRRRPAECPAPSLPPV